MQIVPLQAVPSQTLTITLNGQVVNLNIYTLDTPVIPGLEDTSYPALYVDIALNGAPVVTTRLAAILQPLLTTSDYLGFEGELVFVDVQNPTLAGATQPLYTGLGTQYQLVYLAPSDLA